MLLDNKHITGLLCSFVFCMSLFSAQKPHLYILIHGTMASPIHMKLYGNQRHWCQPGHTSFEIFKNIPNATAIECSWPGGAHLSDLVAGAKKLIRVIQHHSATHTISIVAHSNGGNVALLALDALVRNSQTKVVDELVLLGTPIYLHWYPESIKAAHRIYNLFSYGDVIQQVFGMYQRVLPEQAHIFNIQVKINNECANHNQLCKAEVLEQVPHFSKLFTKKDIYCLQCTTNKEPITTRDTTRNADLTTDKTNIEQLYTSTKDHWVARLKEHGNRYRATATALINDIKTAIGDLQ